MLATVGLMVGAATGYLDPASFRRALRLAAGIQRGAVFVREVDEIPEGATVVFSAHGVTPAVRAAADARCYAAQNRQAGTRRLARECEREKTWVAGEQEHLQSLADFLDVRGFLRRVE